MIEKIKTTIINELPAQDCIIEQVGPSHFQIEVISEIFAGLSTVKRHQLVYKLINPWISSGDMHATYIKTQTPSEQTK